VLILCPNLNQYDLAMTSEVSQMDLVLDTLFHWNIPGQPQAVARVQMHSLSSVWSLLILSEVSSYLDLNIKRSTLQFFAS
jgi:hypothetical protein